MDLEEPTSDKNYSDRLKAIQILQQLPSDSPAVHMLLRFLQDTESFLRVRATNVLKQRSDISLQLLPDLISLLKGSPDSVSRNICEVLAELGQNARAALETIQTLQNKDESAARAVWKITGNAELIKPTLLELLEEPREETCDLIYEIGADASFCLPSLRKALCVDDADVRWAAVDAISALGSKGRDAIPDLVRSLSDKSGVVAGRAAHALGKIGTSAVPALIDELCAGSRRAREFVADALGQIGESASDAVPYLQKLLSDETQDVVHWASIALGEITGTPSVLPVLKRISKETADDTLRHRVIGTIERISEKIGHEVYSKS
jgi:HEAT repeat protein